MNDVAYQALDLGSALPFSLNGWREAMIHHLSMLKDSSANLNGANQHLDGMWIRGAVLCSFSDCSLQPSLPCRLMPGPEQSSENRISS